MLPPRPESARSAGVHANQDTPRERQIPSVKDVLSTPVSKSGHDAVDPAELGPQWLRNPATVPDIKSEEDFINAANDYFERCDDRQIMPQLTGLILATGLTGPTAIYRLARRNPGLTVPISRCLTAIAHGYEQEILNSGASQGARFMLKHLRDFDPAEGPGAPEIEFWNDKTELVVQTNIPGVDKQEDIGADMTPMQAYLHVIHDDDTGVDVLLKAREKAKKNGVKSMADVLREAEAAEEARWEDAPSIERGDRIRYANAGAVSAEHAKD